MESAIIQPTLESANKRESLSLRIRAEERSLIDRASNLRGKTGADFILEAARLAAEETLLDQTPMVVNPDAFAAFLARLEQPPVLNDRLRNTMQTPAPWDGA